MGAETQTAEKTPPAISADDLSLLAADGGDEGETPETETAEAGEGTADEKGEAKGKPARAAAEDSAEEDSESLDADGDAGKAATDKDADVEEDEGSDVWSTLRAATVSKYLSKLESSLKKTVSAADLPKELAKAKTKIENQLVRYGSVEDALLAGISAQDKIRSGKLKAELPEDASEEEVAEWRAQNGIPEDPDGYDIPKIAGFTWTEADKDGLDALKQRAHELNWDQKTLDGVLQVYAERVQEARDAQAEAVDQLDKSQSQEARDWARQEWQAEFKPTLAVIKRYLEDGEVFPEGRGERIALARYEDGSRLINDPVMLKFLGEAARAHYGEGSIVTGQQAQISASEKAELEALMSNNIDDYNNKMWKDTGKTGAERYMEILRKEAGRGRR